MTWLAPSASALLLFLAFLPGPFAWAGFLWAVPLALWAMAEPDARAWRRSTAAASLLTWVALLAWLRHVHPPLGWLGWGLLSAYCALYLWAWLLALRWILPWCGGRGPADRMLGILGLAALWVLLEALRGWALTGFGWLPMAASQAGNPVMLALCESVGQLGLSGALILANLALARWIRRQFVETRPSSGRAPSLLGGLTPELYLGLAPVLAAFWLHLSHLEDEAAREAAGEGSALRVAVVQTDVDPYRKWDPASADGLLRELGRMTSEAGAAGADLVLWPEAATPFPLSDPGYAEHLESLAKAAGATLVLGGVDRREGGYANAIVAFGDEGMLGAAYDKRHLVPFGEYVPFADILPLRKLVPIPQDCVPGTAARLLAAPDPRGRPVLLGPLVCYEDIFPSLARDHALAGAQALVVLTNDAWYGRELGAWQHATHSVLLAAATRLPVARCGNAGWSGWIEPGGRAFPALREGSIYFRGMTDLGERRVPAADRPPTRWTSVGDVPLLLPCALLALLLAMRRLRHPMARTEPRVGDAN